MSKTLQIVKQKGEVLNKDFIIKRLDNIFSLLVNGEHIITIAKQVKRRSIDQNRLMWLWFACIENETGTLKEDIHDYYCMKFLSRVTVINGNDETIVSGTSKLSTAAMKDFLDKVQSDAASEFGMTLPNPDDLHWQEFENNYRHLIYK